MQVGRVDLLHRHRLRSRRLTEPPRPCGERDFASADARRGRSPSGSFPIAPATPSAPTYKLMPKPNVGRSRRLCQPPRPQLRISETTPTSQAEPPAKKGTSQTPAALRERGVWGRGASLREAASPPASSHPSRLFGREREGGDFSTEKSPPSQSHTHNRGAL